MRREILPTLTAFLCLWSNCTSFTFSSGHLTKQKLANLAPRPLSRLYFFDFLKNDSPTSTEDSTAELEDLRSEVEELVISSQGKVPVETLEPLLAQMESLSVFDEPNRSPLYKGRWHVWYSNAPPPSNGKLGPFQGSAEQDIATSDISNAYNNILRLPPNSGDDEWLTVLLKGIWEDWDGVELSDDSNSSVESKIETSEDWGAKFWKVTFLSLNFSVFGKSVANIEFPPNTARIWRTTFLDETTRIVRAGRTGRKEDESIFYMKRTPRPETNP